MAVVGKLLSWVFPYRIKRLEGKLTKVLEVTFENGKKVLNAGRSIILTGHFMLFFGLH